MRVRVAWVTMLACAGCGAHVPTTPGDAGGDDQPDARPGSPDAPPGGPDAMLGLWSGMTMIPTAATDGMGEDDGDPSPLGTELLFSGKLPGINKDIYLLTRMSPADPWGPAVAVDELNTAAGEQTPRFTADGLGVYFGSARGGGVGGDDIWMATRDSLAAAWNPPTLVPAVNSTSDERTLTTCAGGRYVVISFRTGAGDFYQGQLGQAPTLVAELSDPGATETGAFVSADCLRAWFASDRDGSPDIFAAHRDDPDAAWILDGKVTELSTDGDGESDPFVVEGGHTMIFSSTADGGENDLYFATR